MKTKLKQRTKEKRKEKEKQDKELVKRKKLRTWKHRRKEGRREK